METKDSAQQLYRCGRCTRMLPFDAYYKRSNRPVGRQAHCKECTREVRRENTGHGTPEQQRRYKARLRRYQTSDKGKVMQNNNQARMKELYPEKFAARTQLKNAVKKGDVKKVPCHCGETKVEAHHYLGYAPQHALDVVFLCRTHHVAAHNYLTQATERHYKRGYKDGWDSAGGEAMEETHRQELREATELGEERGYQKMRDHLSTGGRPLSALPLLIKQPVACPGCGAEEYADWSLYPHQLYNSYMPGGIGHYCFPCFAGTVSGRTTELAKVEGGIGALERVLEDQEEVTTEQGYAIGHLHVDSYDINNELQRLRTLSKADK